MLLSRWLPFCSTHQRAERGPTRNFSKSLFLKIINRITAWVLTVASFWRQIVSIYKYNSVVSVIISLFRLRCATLLLYRVGENLHSSLVLSGGEFLNNFRCIFYSWGVHKLLFSLSLLSILHVHCHMISFVRAQTKPLVLESIALTIRSPSSHKQPGLYLKRFKLHHIFAVNYFLVNYMYQLWSSKLD